MIGVMEMPQNFKYRDALLKGKPQHSRCDPFTIRHPRMDVGKRAKIFAPFAALKGFEDEVASKEVRYVPQAELSAEDAAELNRRLDILHNLTWNSRMARANHIEISVFFFVPIVTFENEPNGKTGLYKTVTGICRRVDPDVERIIQIDNEIISFDSIVSIDSLQPIFSRSAKGEIYREDV